MSQEHPDWDGILTFAGSHHAMRAEKVLQARGIPVRLVPGPRELTSACGVAARFPWSRRGEVEAALQTEQVEYQSLQLYPEGEELPRGWARFLRKRKETP